MIALGYDPDERDYRGSTYCAGCKTTLLEHKGIRLPTAANITIECPHCGTMNHWIRLNDTPTTTANKVLRDSR